MLVYCNIYRKGSHVDRFDRNRRKFVPKIAPLCRLHLRRKLRSELVIGRVLSQ